MISKAKIMQRLRAAHLKRATAGIKDINDKRLHVDDWLDYSGKEFYTPQPSTNDSLYAKFVLEYMRMPAFKINGYSKFMNNNKLYCTFAGKRYRVTMASRLGTIGLREDLQIDNGYDVNAFVNQCTDWSNNP